MEIKKDNIIDINIKGKLTAARGNKLTCFLIRSWVVFS